MCDCGTTGTCMCLHANPKMCACIQYKLVNSVATSLTQIPIVPETVNLGAGIIFILLQNKMSNIIDVVVKTRSIQASVV